jgi:suppressor of fused-like protein
MLCLCKLNVQNNSHGGVTTKDASRDKFTGKKISNTPPPDYLIKFCSQIQSPIPLCRGRLNHGRHFTFRSFHGDTVITFVSDGIEGAWASEMSRLVASGSWLQVYLGKQDGKKILEDIQHLLINNLEHQLPATLEWPELHLRVTVAA